ncbi:hypothetical protein RUND412_008000 [Rhizina undulata]
MHTYDNGSCVEKAVNTFHTSGRVGKFTWGTTKPRRLRFLSETLPPTNTLVVVLQVHKLQSFCSVIYQQPGETPYVNLAEMLRASASANSLEQNPRAGQWQHGPMQMVANNSQNHSKEQRGQNVHGPPQRIANNSQSHSAEQWQHGHAEMVANNSWNNPVEQWQHGPAQPVANDPPNHIVEPWYLTIHVHGLITKRPMRISFWKCNIFNGFVTVVNNILLELGGSQLAGPGFPNPFGWLVVADDGAIINGNFWEEFLTPCVDLWIVPLDLKFENAPSTPNFRATPLNNSGILPQVDSVGEVVISNSSAAALDSQAPAAGAYSVQTQHQPAEEDNSISSNFTALPGQNAKLTTPEQGLTMDEFEAAESSHANAHTTTEAQSVGPPKKMKYSEAVALAIPDENNTRRQELTPVPRVPGNTQYGSTVIIHLFERDIFPSRYRRMKVSTSMKVGEFIAYIGGTARCRIQELKQAPKPTAPDQPGQFFPGATYMYGTQKTILAAGWAEKAEFGWGYFGVVLRKALPPHPKSLAADH